MERQDQATADHHGKVAETQLPYIGRQETPNSHSQWITGVLDIPENGGDDHEEQSDPKQGKETTEVVVIASRIEVRYSRHIIDCVE